MTPHTQSSTRMISKKFPLSNVERHMITTVKKFKAISKWGVHATAPFQDTCLLNVVAIRRSVSLFFPILITPAFKDADLVCLP
jgi:hypothetical protein